MNLPPNTIQTTHRKRKLTYKTRTTLAGMVGKSLAVLFYLAAVALAAVAVVRLAAWIGG